MTSSTKMFCSQKPVEFRVPPVAGTYRLEAKELLILHRVILPPLPFDFSKAVFRNAESRDSGRTVVALGQNGLAGCVTCQPILRSRSSASWHIFCRNNGSCWNGSFGVVKPSTDETNTGISWRKRNTAAIFCESGVIFRSSLSGSSRKDDSFDFPQIGSPCWGPGDLFAISIARVGEDLHSTSCVHQVRLVHKRLDGMVQVTGCSMDMRPYFWL
eukprot:scpid52448/ scgid8042/ 